MSTSRSDPTAKQFLWLLLLLLHHQASWVSAFTAPNVVVKSSQNPRIKGSKSTPLALLATSSKELRNREENKKKARDAKRKTKRKTTTRTRPKKKSTKMALTQRLQQATAKAKAAALEADYALRRQQVDDDDGGAKNKLGRPPFSLKNNPITEHPVVMGTLSQLTKVIDQELRSANDGTATFNVHGTTNPPPGISRDSMRSLLEENDAQSNTLQRKSQGTDGSMVRHIAVVMSKPLSRDQVTLEYACRLRALAKAIQAEDGNEETLTSMIANDENEQPSNNNNTTSSSYRPNIVCFLGGTSQGNLVSDADAGYIYFNHLCAANQISLEGIDVMLERATLGKGALKNIMRHLRREYIPEWFKEQRQQQNQTKQEALQRNSKVQLHFTFFSCDYDLCRLNDIHYRSPQQSILKPLIQDTEDASGRSSDVEVQSTWSYRYATYPYVHFKDAVTAFLGKCYLLAQELTPVLVNIHGVVDGTEFFQRDNYRLLVSIRHSFVEDMEMFYQSQPSLKSTLRQYVSNTDYSLDVVLEGALLSLGRCLDLVRPAGLLIGYVSKTDWKNAEMVLEHAVRQLRDACDPDHPLDPADWGKLDHHYDQPSDLESTDSSVADLASLNHWRLVQGENQEPQDAFYLHRHQEKDSGSLE